MLSVRLLIISAFALLLVQFPLIAQKTSGYIISVEGAEVYTDLGAGHVAEGDRLTVVEEGGSFTHPVTGAVIQREDRHIANLEVLKVHDEYSVARAYPAGAEELLKPGMLLRPTGAGNDERVFRKRITILPFKVEGVKGGFLGNYMGDILQQELHKKDIFTIIDNDHINPLDPVQLTDFVAENQIDFIISGISTPPEVTETSTGVPVKGILETAEVLSGQNLGSGLVSDVSQTRMHAIATVNLKVLNASDKELLFSCKEMAETEGMSNLTFEQGALGGLKLQGGVAGFFKTVSGQATGEALENASGYIHDYLEGTITEPYYEGNIIELGTINRRTAGNGYRITGVEQHGQYHVATVNAGKEDRIGKRKKMVVLLPNEVESGLTGKVTEDGTYKFGMISFSNIEFDASAGRIYSEKEIGRDLERKLKNDARLKVFSPFSYDLSLRVGYNSVTAVTTGSGVGVRWFPAATTSLNTKFFLQFNLTTVINILEQGWYFSPADLDENDVEQNIRDIWNSNLPYSAAKIAVEFRGGMAPAAARIRKGTGPYFGIFYRPLKIGSSFQNENNNTSHINYTRAQLPGIFFGNGFGAFQMEILASIHRLESIHVSYYSMHAPIEYNTYSGTGFDVQVSLGFNF